MAKILYVEDDPSLGFVTKDSLEEEGFQIFHFSDGKAAWKFFKKEKFDLCLLDVMLPEMDGFSLAEKIREQNPHIPIIFLSARLLDEDRIQGLKIGGDDYITKPFNIEELILKVRIFLKRNSVSDYQISSDYYKCGAYDFSYKQLTLAFDDQIQKLTHREAEVLKFFLERKNQVVKREDILIAIWGRDDYFLGRSLDVFLTRIRKMLSKDPNIKIENIHGVGFRLLS